MRATTFYLPSTAIDNLRRFAASRGYTQRRGPGAKVSPSISQFLSALAAGELVAVGPLSWRTVIGALEKAISNPDLTDEENEAITALRRQILMAVDPDNFIS